MLTANIKIEIVSRPDLHLVCTYGIRASRPSRVFPISRQKSRTATSEDFLRMHRNNVGRSWSSAKSLNSVESRFNCNDEDGRMDVKGESGGRRYADGGKKGREGKGGADLDDLDRQRATASWPRKSDDSSSSVPRQCTVRRAACDWFARFTRVAF